MTGNKKIKVIQTVSSIGRNSVQEKILKGLKLNKLNRISILEDTPAIRGMIFKVKHLIKLEEI